MDACKFGKHRPNAEDTVTKGRPPNRSKPLSNALLRVLSELSADELASTASQGCDASLQGLIEKLQPSILRYFRGRYPTQSAEDLCQEVLFAISNQIMKFDARRPIWPWVKTIAHRKWVDQLRWDNRNLSLEEYREIDDIPTVSPNDIELNLTLSVAISTLPPKQKDALHLTKTLGFSIEEASAMTGQSESLIKQNVFRARKKIRTFLNGCN